MNVHLAKLVGALRSGEYSQTQSVLHDMAGYCCLGVACDLYRRETGRGEWRWDASNSRYDFVVSSSDCNSHYLPLSVQDWLGLHSRNGGWRRTSNRDSLVALNDLGKPFSEIADAIEAHEEELVTEPHAPLTIAT